MRESHGAYNVSHSPYPGLRAFAKEENDVFFGRDDHVDLLLKKLAEAHFVCVTGPSGCGKSSLVRTGLQNALEAGFLPGRGSDWIFCDFNPGIQPLEAMTGKLAKACAEHISAAAGADTAAAAEEEVRNMLSHGIKDARLGNDLTRILSPLDLGGRPILLFVDQFEELFRYAQHERNAAVRFVEILLQTATAKRDIFVVITIRTDELERCSRYTGLTRAINESQFLTPILDRYQIQEAIEGPIAIFGGKIDPKLTIWLLNSLEEEMDKLPLMQHALKLLYAHKTAKEARPDVCLVIEDFATVFGLSSKFDFFASDSRHALSTTLESRLEAIYHGLPEDRLKRAAARLFCALTVMEGGSRDIRRPLPFAELARTIGESEADTRAIIAAFRDGDESYLIVKGGEDGTVDVPHECVLRLWPRLQKRWLANERESADNIRDLARRAKNWDGATKRGSLLGRLFLPDVLKGYTLQNYRDWFAKRHPNKYWASRHLLGFPWRVGPREAERQLSTEEIFDMVEELFEASTRYRRQFQWSLGIGAAVTLATIAYGSFAQLQSSKMQRQTAYMTITQKVTELKAGPYPVTNLMVATTAAREALNLGDPAVSDVAAGNLWEVLASVREITRASNGVEPEREVFSAQFANGDRTLLTLDRWARAREWPLSSRRFVSPRTIDEERGPAVQGRSLAVSPLGDIAAAGYNDGSVRIFDLKSAESRPYPLLAADNKPHASFILDLTFSRDGSRLFTSSHDGTIWSWSRVKPDGRLAGAEETAKWTPRVVVDMRHLGPAPLYAGAEAMTIWSLDVDDETRSVAFGLQFGRVCVVRLQPAAMPSCSNAGHDHEKTIKAVRFQPGRATLVSAGNDDRIAFWRLTANSGLVPTATRIFEDSDIWDLDFSADGRLMASASWDGTARIYDPDERRLLATLPGHEQSMRTIRFDRSSRFLATGSHDGTARIFTPFESRLGILELSYQFPRPPADKPKKSLSSVAIGADGTWVAFQDGSNAYVKRADRDAPEKLATPAEAIGLSPGPAAISQLRAHPSSPIVVASSNQPFIFVWSREAAGSWRASTVPLPGELMAPRPLAVSADGAMLAVVVKDSVDATILLCPLADSGGWSCADGVARKIAFPKRHGGLVPTALAFSPSGGSLAAGASDGKVRLFDLGASSASELPFEGMKEKITSLAFAPDGKSLVSASADKSLLLWNLADHSFVILKGHKSHIPGAAFSANGKWIASASQDESVIIWNAADGKPLARLPIERDSILSFDVRKTPRGTLMVTGSAAGNVSVMHFFENADEVLQHAETFLTESIGLAPERL